MDNTRLTFLFYRYVNRTCSESERQELLGLLADPENETQAKQLMSEVWDEVQADKLSDARAAHVFNQILNATPARKRPVYWRKIAAVFLVVILGTTGLSYFMSGDSQFSRSYHEMPNDIFPGFIKLADGSTVILKAGSRLDYPLEFSGKNREVFLEGEGFFDVVEDPSREFVVHTGELRTTVLGTAFNVKAYPDQQDITVTVKRGKVKVSDRTQVFGIVSPDQQITFDRNHQQVKQNPVDSHQVTSWIEKDISFDDVTFGEAIDQLESRFDVHIQLINTRIMDCRFTATFVREESLEQMLEILCEFNSADLSSDDEGGFIIQGGECPAGAVPEE